jgi:hypothetical protein
MPYRRADGRHVDGLDIQDGDDLAHNLICQILQCRDLHRCACHLTTSSVSKMRSETVACVPVFFCAGRRAFSSRYMHADGKLGLPLAHSDGLLSADLPKKH